MSKIKTPDELADQIIDWLDGNDLSETNQKQTLAEMIKGRDLDYIEQKIKELELRESSLRLKYQSATMSGLGIRVQEIKIAIEIMKKWKI